MAPVAARLVYLLLRSLFKVGKFLGDAYLAPKSVYLKGIFVVGAFKQGDWNLGNKWKWMAPVAVIEIIIVSIYFIMPLSPAGVWWSADFKLTSANYAPVAFIVVLGGAMIWWWASAHNHFKGAVRTLD